MSQSITHFCKDLTLEESTILLGELDDSTNCSGVVDHQMATLYSFIHQYLLPLVYRSNAILGLQNISLVAATTVGTEENSSRIPGCHSQSFLKQALNRPEQE